MKKMRFLSVLFVMGLTLLGCSVTEDESLTKNSQMYQMHLKFVGATNEDGNIDFTKEHLAEYNESLKFDLVEYCGLTHWKDFELDKYPLIGVMSTRCHGTINGTCPSGFEKTSTYFWVVEFYDAGTDDYTENYCRKSN